MKKVLFFHGMGGGELDDKTIEYIKDRYNIEIISPHLQYEMWVGNPNLFPLLEHLGKDVDVISGNSMGGYFAYHLGKLLNKETILFNPAISNVTLSYRLFNNITPHLNEPVDNTIVSNLSTLDDVVDHLHTRRFLNESGGSSVVINDLIDKTHSLDYNLILKKVIEFTLDKSLNIKQDAD